ncbi:MAG: hypothetical protein Q7T55_09275, partial [Solirubrobacteraceae bacterium]|nr:hypothetical protein [Solirubrobacteraceae bacterium]
LLDLRARVLAQIEPKLTLVALLQAVVSTGPSASPAVRAGPMPIDTVMAAPRFDQPMYAPLRDLSPELLLPGLERVTANSVLGLATNRRFVEAYLVGLNVEMGRELLWRGFPTDQRGTCFAHFWDSAAASAPRPDIEPLHRWGTRPLGDAEGAPAREQFVMLMRSALLRRYPGAVIYAAKAEWRGDRRVPSTQPQDEVHPSFRGSVEPDVSFFGFDLTVKQAVGTPGDASGPSGDEGWFIVLQEQPGEPRFGFDLGAAPSGASHVRIGDAAPPGLPLPAGLAWGRNAAHMAGITRQLPMRIAIHASQFIARPLP